jgi:8-oxo-dGTP pyrophosphatase MutT (NUDIX family)
VPELEWIRSRLAEHVPREVPVSEWPDFQAAVALVLHQPEGGAGELLFIERTRREGDPWSGHMAFPGGRRGAGDRDLQETAARETLEEVGVTLAEPIGRLDHQGGDARLGSVVPRHLVAPFVYQLPERPGITTNHEVNAAVWIPLRWILAPESWVCHGMESAGQELSFPAFRYRDYTVWGLTYRILFGFLTLLGREIPPPSH